MAKSKYDQATRRRVLVVRIIMLIAMVLNLVFLATRNYYWLIPTVIVMVGVYAVGWNLRKLPRQQATICEFVKDFDDSKGMKAGRIYSDEEIPRGTNEGK